MIVAAKLAGRCSDGWERGQGTKVHALENPLQPNQWTIYGDALCKATPGRKSVGWTPMGDSNVTCPKCLRAIEAKEKNT
jgi:hypothetical protein